MRRGRFAVVATILLAPWIASAQVPISITFTPTSVIGGQSITGKVTLSGLAQAAGFVVSLQSSAGVAPVAGSVTAPSGASFVNFTITTLIPAQTTQVTITATGGGQTATGTFTVFSFQAASITLTPGSVVGGATSTGQVTLNQPAPAAGVAVQLSSSATNAATVPATVTVPSGSMSANFTVTTLAVAQPVTVTITATAGGVSKTRTLPVGAMGPTALTLSPATVAGGQSSTATVTISSPAPNGGAVVALSVGLDRTTVPASVTVPAGATSATFTVNTLPAFFPTLASIDATYNGVMVRTNINILAPVPSVLTVTPATIVGGQNATGSVTLSSQTLTQGHRVYLTSSQPNVVTVPSYLTVGNAGLTGSFPVTTTAVNATTIITVTASAGGTDKTVNVTVNPLVVTSTVNAVVVGPSSITIAPTTVTGGKDGNGQVILSQAPTSPLVVSLASGNPAAARAPTSVTVPAGATSASFRLETFPVARQTLVAISATANGVAKSSNFSVSPPLLAEATVLAPPRGSPSNSKTLEIKLNGLAAKGGHVVNILSSAPTATTLPLSVVVPAGTDVLSVVFQSKNILAPTLIVLRITLGVTKTVSFTANP